ncbi:hypothetical protein [Flavobacterium sp. JP2137]|uniref:hypothetical protein n=1 Tax=Flavobacterium sp. JP2137 TaxID=3414510 RepID=UPI003D2FBB94
MSKIYKEANPLAPFEVKLTDEYGLNVAKLISTEWFGGARIAQGCQFMTRREYVKSKRKFVRGEIDLTKFKSQIAKSDNDLSYLNLDFRYINLGEKFCLIVANGISDENYILDIRAMDKISINMKESKQNEYRKYMASRKLLESVQKDLGIDLMPKSFVPDNEEEMEMLMDIKDRPKIEIAEEILINWIKHTNNWSYIEDQKNKDSVAVGLIVARVWTDKNDGVKVDYVDPENYIHSEVKRNDFDDKFYEGVVDSITISDLKRESGFDDLTLSKIAGLYNQAYKDGNDNISLTDQALGSKVDVLRFAYKTVKTIKYKKKLRNGEPIKLSRRPDTFIAPEQDDVSELSNTFDTWLEGNYVIGSEYIYGWKECENLYDDVMNKAMSPFVTYAYDIYENKLRSFTDNIEVIADRMQLTALKIQHLISELTPDLKEIDLDMLAELDDGKGGTKRAIWQTALDIMGAKGVVFKKRIDMGEDGLKDSHAIRPMAAQQGSAISILLNSWAHDYNLIRENTGINPARDGSMPSDALVGVNQLAQMASNTVTKNIVRMNVLFNLKVCEVISTRIQAIYNYSEASKIREIYNNVIGKHMMDHLSILKNRHLHEFGFTFNMMPTSLEIQEFKEDLGIALQEGFVSPEIKSEATNIFKTNPKLARKYLYYHRRKERTQRMEEQMAAARDKSKNDALSAQAAEEAKTNAYQFKKQIDLQYASGLSKIKLTEQKGLQEIMAPTKDKEFQQEVYLAQLTKLGKENLEGFKEDRKDDRTKLQASQQSEMIDQRNNKKPAIDFEDNFDFDKFLGQ